MAIPTLDAPLAQYSTNFQARGSSAPSDFSLTVAQMAQYTTLHGAFISAFNASSAKGARCKALTQAKNDCKWALLRYARSLYYIVQGSPSTTNENRALIGVHVRDFQPTRQDPPSQAPVISLLFVVGRVARYKLIDATTPNSRHRPGSAQGATILSFVGANPPPVGEGGWKLEGQTGRTKFQVQFGNDVVPGTACWVTAMWYNKRGQYSPAGMPVQTYLQVGPVAQAA